MLRVVTIHAVDSPLREATMLEVFYCKPLSSFHGDVFLKRHHNGEVDDNFGNKYASVLIAEFDDDGEMKFYKTLGVIKHGE